MSTTVPSTAKLSKAFSWAVGSLTEGAAANANPGGCAAGLAPLSNPSRYTCSRYSLLPFLNGRKAVPVVLTSTGGSGEVLQLPGLGWERFALRGWTRSWDLSAPRGLRHLNPLPPLPGKRRTRGQQVEQRL